MSIETHYKHLEARPESWREQWYLKERNLTVWQGVGRMQAHGYSSAEAAEQFDLPLEAVLEAVDYYQRHKDLVDAETAEEGRRLRAAGTNGRKSLCGAHWSGSSSPSPSAWCH